MATTTENTGALGRIARFFRLSGTQFLIAGSAPFLIPIVVFGYFVVTALQAEVAFTHNERRGVRYLAPVFEMMRSVQEHRAASANFIGRGEEVRKGFDAAEVQVEQFVKQIDTLDAEMSTVWALSDKWSKVKQSWRELRGAVPKLTPAQSLARHHDMVLKLQTFAIDVADASQLTLDPDVDTFYLMDAAVLKLPLITEDLGRMRATGATALASKVLSDENRGSLNLLKDRLSEGLFNAFLGLPRAYAHNPDVRAALEVKGTELVSGTQAIIKLAEDQILNAQTLEHPTDLWIADTTRIIRAVFAYDKEVFNKLDALLEARVKAKTRDMVTRLSIAVATTLLALFVLWLVNRIQGEQSRARTQAVEDENQRNQKAIMRLMDEMGPIADGKLTARATVDEQITGAVADSLNNTVDELRKLVTGVTTTAVQVTEGALSAQQITQQLLIATKKQADEVERAGGSVELMTKSISEVNASATQSAESARKSLATTARGAGAVQDAVKSMNLIRDQIQDTAKRIKRLGESSQEIGEIVEVISDITEQTNVLALNAAIQAASAGEAGRGFTVVAEEVQRLAERSAEATKQIGALVKAIQTDTQDAVAAMEKSTEGVVQGAQLSDTAGAALAEIERSTRELAELVQSIATSTEMQVSIANEVADNMKQTLALTEQATQGVNKAAATVGTLATQAESLRGSVVRFQVA